MNKGEAIAQQLRQAREQQGKSIQQVHQSTGISVNVLTGFEAGDFTVVEPVYTRLALRTCAQHLGLDGEALVRQFDAEYGRPAPPPPLPPPRPVVAVPQPPARSPARPPQSEGFGSLARLLALCVGGLVVVFAAVYWFERQEGDDEREPGPLLAPIAPERATRAPVPAPGARPSAEIDANRPALPATDSLPVVRPPAPESAPMPVPLPASALPATAPTAATAGAPGAGAMAPPAAAPPRLGPGTGVVPSDSVLVLEAEALDSTWVRVEWEQGGKSETIMKPGTRRRWESRDHFVFQSGRGRGVRLWFQGKPVGEDGLIGDPNRVLRVRVSRQGHVLLNRELQPLGSSPPARDPAAARPDTAP